MQRSCFFTTVSGQRVDLCHMRPEDFDPLQIARSLAHQCRFVGHTQRYYSIAEHSVHVSYLVSESCKLQALLRSAPKAYLGEVSKPLRQVIGNVYDELEADIWNQICIRFDIDPNVSTEVTDAERMMLHIEHYTLQEKTQHSWYDFKEIAGMDHVIYECWPPELAAHRYLDRLVNLEHRS